MNIEAYRYQGVNHAAFSYWHWSTYNTEGAPFVKASASACAPLAVFVKEYDHNFYSGEQVPRELPVYNDMFHDARLLLEWRTVRDGKTIKYSRASLVLKAGESLRRKITITMPVVATRTPIQFRVTVSEPGALNRYTCAKD